MKNKDIQLRVKEALYFVKAVLVYILVYLFCWLLLCLVETVREPDPLVKLGVLLAFFPVSGFLTLRIMKYVP